VLQPVYGENDHIEDFIALDANQPLLDLMGRSREQVIGTGIRAHYNLSFFRGVLIDACTIAEKTQQMIGGSMEIMEGRWFTYQVIPLDDGIAISAQDTTEQRVSEERRVALATEKNRAEFLQTFIRSTSHDLFTPLTQFQTGLYLLQRTEPNLSEKSTRRIEEMNKSVLRLTTMIKDMQKLVRLSQLEKATPSNMKSAKLNDLLHDLVREFQSMVEKKSQTLTFHPESKLPNVLVIQDIWRVFSNLIENAIKYTDEGGEIRVSTHCNDDKVQIVVEDNGIGIPADEQKRIFDSLYRVEKNRPTTSGMGLGLAITKRLVEINEGEISVTSEPGKGTRFVVTLPVHYPAATNQNKV
jgi:signal transduction histidine kinase